MTSLSAWTRFFDHPVPNIALRVAVMLAGLAIVAFGIDVSRATEMGTTVISCIPAALSYAFPEVSMGVFTFWFNVLLLVIQIALLRKEFKPLQLLCIPFVFVFSAIIDLLAPLAGAIPMPNYGTRLLFSVVSCGFIALGVWLQVQAKLVVLPGEGVVLAFSHVCKAPFALTKTVNDCTMMVLGCAVSLCLMGGLYGVREGTLIAAVLVGYIIRFINKLVPDLEAFCPTKGHPALTPNQ